MQEYRVRVFDDHTEWFQDGKLHRTDGPAIEWANGGKSWYQNGQLHRIDGPAIEWVYGHRSWFRHGIRHRIDGPATEYTDGDREWCINGHHLTEKEFNARTKPACNGKVVGIDGVKYKLTPI